MPDISYGTEESVNGEYVLHEDYARLKAEVEAQAKRWAESEDLISHYKEQRDEVINDCQCSRLKAEVERLTFHPELYLDDDGEWVSNIVFYRMQERLKAEVERLDTLSKQLMAQHSNISCENIMLRKAGDAMAFIMAHQKDSEFDGFVEGWNAAKEGKPQS
jgi:hypothetical protein